ncbi:MAG: hypothetical protein JWN02_1099 [Acidobacteria bacterium]|nr:hypothetical protein [Acidobacteriota bacterium]
MNKILIGILLGGALGAVDGMTAWFTPAVRAGIIGIVIGSTFKGVIAGIAAGWFAKKVNNVVAGILFGLGVGAILAFLVAYMQHGYYFEIMLPGSLVGAIVGWATQRYGRRGRASVATTGAAAAMLLLVAVGAHAGTEGNHPVSAADAFARLKSLDGKWQANLMTPDGPIIAVEYRTTAGGNAVMETLFTGDPHEMVTMYTVDGKELVATHYCSAGNQPTMRLDLVKSTPDQLVFDFVRVSGQHAHDAPHIHDGSIRFMSADKVEARWEARADNGPAGDPKVFYLTRK